jgi:hypothetical protein
VTEAYWPIQGETARPLSFCICLGCCAVGLFTVDGSVHSYCANTYQAMTTGDGPAIYSNYVTEPFCNGTS